MAVALCAPIDAALAATVEVVEVGTGGLVGQELQLEAEPFESNMHRVEPVPGGYRITATGAGPVRAGAGCVDTSPDGGAEREVTCSGSNIIRSSFRLGDLADFLFADRMKIQVNAYGAADQDQLNGGARGDLLYGGAGVDELRGWDGRDALYGGGGADLIRSDGGDDRALGSDGSDNITGGPGDDQINGGDGRDYLDGSEGEDRLVGAKGNDTIISSTGATLRSRDNARDVVNCGPGTDRVSADRKDELNGCEKVTFG